MKIFSIIIKPVSAFSTPIMGDTIFGHICWQIAEDSSLFKRTIEELLSDYTKKPFIIISEPFPTIYDNREYLTVMKKPNIPPDILFASISDNERIKQRKTLQKKNWCVINEKFSEPVNYKWISDKELTELFSSKDSFNEANTHYEHLLLETDRTHNTINRFSNTTGDNEFAPFTESEIFYHPEINFKIFVGVRNDIDISQIIEAFKRIGNYGYGKNASSGSGKFKVIKIDEVDLFKMGSKKPNACYTLGLSVIKNHEFLQQYFLPFVRFGRHGNMMSHSSVPFKKPILLAKEGSVFVTNNSDTFNKPYLGNAITNISLSLPQSVSQGYSLYIPVYIEGLKNG